MLSVQKVEDSKGSANSFCKVSSSLVEVVAPQSSSLGMVTIFNGANLDLASNKKHSMSPFAFMTRRYDTAP